MSDLPVYPLNVLVTVPLPALHFSLIEQPGRKCAVISIGSVQIPKRKRTLLIFDFRPEIVQVCERKKGKILDEVDKAEMLNCVNNPAQTCLGSFSVKENDTEEHQHVRVWLYPLHSDCKIVGNFTLELHGNTLECKIVREKDLPIRHTL